MSYQNGSITIARNEEIIVMSLNNKHSNLACFDSIDAQIDTFVLKNGGKDEVSFKPYNIFSIRLLR